MGKELIIEAFTNYEGDKDALLNQLTKICGWTDITLTESHRVGKIGEAFFKDMLNDTINIEVKTEDDVWASSGNLFIEDSQWSQQEKKYLPSSIETTKSDIWCIALLDDKWNPIGGMHIKTQIVKDVVNVIKNDTDLYKIYHKNKPKNAKGTAGSGYVIPIDMLFGYSKSKVDLLATISFLSKTIENLEDKLAETIRK